MEATLFRLNKHWTGGKYDQIHRRSQVDNLIKKKNLPHIQVLTGIRRSGKSSIFRLMINDLIENGTDPKEILFLNMDEPIFTGVWNNSAELYEIIKLAEKTTLCKVKYLFLDEIQQVKDWELFAKSAYDTQHFKKIYVTGSNSDLLQNKFATLLSGRYFANTVRPFSIKEILGLHGFTRKFDAISRKSELLALIDRYMQWGGFPEIVLNDMDDDIKTELLNSYYESIVLKDCIVYNQVRDTPLFKRLLHFTISNVASPFHYSNLAKAVKSSEPSVRNYLAYAASSYIVSDITNFSFSLKEDTRPQHKIYCIDNGLMNAIGFRFSPKSGTLLESSVYNELVNAGYDEIYFIRKSNECDFIVKKDDKYHALQVCYELNLLNQGREVNGFRALEKNLNLSSRTIITYDSETTIEDIDVIPFWQFFGI